MSLSQTRPFLETNVSTLNYISKTKKKEKRKKQKKNSPGSFVFRLVSQGSPGSPPAHPPRSRFGSQPHGRLGQKRPWGLGGKIGPQPKNKHLFCPVSGQPRDPKKAKTKNNGTGELIPGKIWGRVTTAVGGQTMCPWAGSAGIALTE